MKVFLSHSTKDDAFVEKLSLALEANGFTPWRCESDVGKGDNFVAKINEGLSHSDLALLLWSSHAASSAWTTEEWTWALARQVEENRIRLGVILLRDCPMPLPPLLRTKVYIDARRDEESGVRETLEWLKGRQRVGRLSGLHAPVYLPEYRPLGLVDRNSYLERLHNALNLEPAVFLLYGEPGAGKSTLALSFAWDVQRDFDAVIFQTCGQRHLDAITSKLVERLPIDAKTRPSEEQRAMVKAWLRERRSLLVLDDVWSADIRQLDPGPPCSVLYTSRHQTLPGIATTQSAKVERFTDTESEKLFHINLDPIFGETEVAHAREGLLEFARRVAGLPIAVAVGASMLREMSAIPLSRAVLRLQFDALTDGVNDINILFRRAIDSQCESEQRLLAACAVCVQEGFWLPLAVEIAGLSEDEAEGSANQLVHASLLHVVDRGRRRFNLHFLMREQVRAQQGGEVLALLMERHAAALENIFAGWQTRWQDCRDCVEEFFHAAIYLSDRGEQSRLSNLIKFGFESGIRIAVSDDNLWTWMEPLATSKPEGLLLGLNDAQADALAGAFVPHFTGVSFAKLREELENLC
jgi:TIR domain/NB-ARC domain